MIPAWTAGKKIMKEFLGESLKKNPGSVPSLSEIYYGILGFLKEFAIKLLHEFHMKSLEKSTEESKRGISKRIL